jgi:hemoglobin
MKRTIFDRYGGFANVSRVVTTFYGKMIDSEIAGPYFREADMRRLIDHQTKFIATVMGGPISFSDDQLERAHARHGIDEAAFNETISLLREALEEHDFTDEDIREVIDGMQRRKHLIVTRS